MIGFGGQWGYYTLNETDGIISGVPRLRTPWVLCGHRYYDSQTLRFVTRDPSGYEGGINLYAFCGNNPVVHADPDGTGPREIWEFIKGGASNLNPLANIPAGWQLRQVYDTKGGVATMKAVASGWWGSITEFTRTKDPYKQGKSIGALALSAAPFAKKLAGLPCGRFSRSSW